MNIRKPIAYGVFLTALLILFGAAWQPAFAGRQGVYSVKAGKTIELGKQGLFFGNVPRGVSMVYANVSAEPLPQRFNHDTDISFRPPWMEMKLMNENGGTVEENSALVYVFFNIGKAEKQLWYEGGSEKIAIWYVNERTSRWVMCPTFFINENLDNGTYDRLACIAPGSGYFVLGHLDFDKLKFNPYRHDNTRVIQFKRKHIAD